MAYSSANLAMQVPDLGGTSAQVWVYKSADSFATVKAANYIADAQNQGMRVRDIIAIVDTATPATTLANILTVTSSGATMSQTGVVIAE